VEDAPEKGGIVIRALDEAYGGTGRLDISDAELRRAYHHFAQATLGGLSADVDLPHTSQTHMNFMHDSFLEVALTQELVSSLLDAVHFEVNGFGDEWFLHLPGFGRKTRAEVLGHDLGPSICVAAGPGGPLLSSESRPGRPVSRQGAPRPLSSRLAKKQPLEARLRTLETEPRDIRRDPRRGLAQRLGAEQQASRAHGCSSSNLSAKKPWLPTRSNEYFSQASTLSAPVGDDRSGQSRSPSPSSRWSRQQLYGSGHLPSHVLPYFEANYNYFAADEACMASVQCGETEETDGGDLLTVLEPASANAERLAAMSTMMPVEQPGLPTPA